MAARLQPWAETGGPSNDKGGYNAARFVGASYEVS